MTSGQIKRARALLDDLEKMQKKPDAYRLIRELRSLLAPPPTMLQILEAVPGNGVIEKSAKIGITRQAFHLLVRGRVRPIDKTVNLLAKATGLPAETIRAAATM